MWRDTLQCVEWVRSLEIARLWLAELKSCETVVIKKLQDVFFISKIPATELVNKLQDKLSGRYKVNI